MRRFFYAISNDTDNSEDTTYPRLSTLPIGASVELTESIVHHWCRVLRANVGDKGFYSMDLAVSIKYSYRPLVKSMPL